MGNRTRTHVHSRLHRRSRHEISFELSELLPAHVAVRIPSKFTLTTSEFTYELAARDAGRWLVLQDVGYFSAIDAGPGDGAGDELEHVAARGPHGGRHRWSRARRRPDAVVAAPATAEPTCGRLSPQLSRRGHSGQPGGDHVEFLVRHGHRRVAKEYHRPPSVLPASASPSSSWIEAHRSRKLCRVLVDFPVGGGRGD